MRIGSLFSGVGGLERGLELAGLGHTVWQVEQGEFQRRILAKHWPNVRRYTDVREVGAHNLEPVDLICGGFPCQDLSSAARGRGGGLQGEKSGLFYEMLRICNELRPEWIVIENVATWKTWLPVVRRELWAAGYASVPFRVRAADVGAPHGRARIFVVAYADGEGEPTVRLDGEVARLQAIAIASRKDWRTPPPEALGVVDGVPFAMDRLIACGNAVVPQVAEVIGKTILCAMERP